MSPLPRPNNVSAKILRAVTKPIQNFMHVEASSGLALLCVTAVALFFANSHWADFYNHLLHTELSVRLGSFELKHGLQHWVNDALMVIFFFVVGLEIKRELTRGEISTLKTAALPFFAALGGVCAPALIYFFFNQSSGSVVGWAVPISTDIAFAIGVLSLFGSRVPFGLKVFLLALAIIDDLVAVLVIAFFYTKDLQWMNLFWGIALLGLTYLFNFSGIRSRLIYVVLGIVTWLFVLKSGVHATIAGVALGLLTPIRALIPLEELSTAMNRILNDLNSKTADQRLEEMRLVVREAQAPLDQLIQQLHLWVAFLVMPLFAFFNAGVRIDLSQFASIFTHPMSLGIVCGLFLGKPLGISLASYLVVRLKWAELPKGVRWTQLFGVGSLAGIGFTMAIFLANLSFEDAQNLNQAKLAVLLASLLSALVGSIILFTLTKSNRTRSSAG